MQVLYLALFFSIAFFLTWVPVALFTLAFRNLEIKQNPCQDIYLVALCFLIGCFLLIPGELRSSLTLFAEFKSEFIQVGVTGALFSAFCVIRRRTMGQLTTRVVSKA